MARKKDTSETSPMIRTAKQVFAVDHNDENTYGESEKRNDRTFIQDHNHSLTADCQSVHMTVDGHDITLNFSKDYNPTLSALVRSTLLDAFIRENSLYPE